ncbi:hypothetical protein ACGFYO_12530 [Streptomyces sp. NPDC048201]|uniref:hypothetical protein n=1 Tax=unclassified Streptomyces TaxID=2593676 RepID=UPI00136AEAC7|nr:hypothetical protein [Streptomyces sp. SID4982]MYS13772.1 hypothetical protein [Streptomyces sp. SID4982]
MAEHDSDREGRDPDEPGTPFDEDAAWRAIVAGYGDEPPDPPGSRPFRSIVDLALPEKDVEPDEDADDEEEDQAEAAEGSAAKPAPVRPLGSSVVFAPGVGPRDHSPAEPDDEGTGDDDGEGHFVPPEPPPLPVADTTAKFAWLGVVGGPILLLLAVLLGWEMTWWLATLAIGGFLGGFVTLVTRMRTDDDGDDDPGRGAVV